MNINTDTVSTNDTTNTTKTTKTTNETTKTDFSFFYEGAPSSIFQLTPNNQKAKDWILENIQTEPWQWLGNNLSIDYRFSEILVCAISIAGFSIE